MFLGTCAAAYHSRMEDSMLTHTEKVEARIEEMNRKQLVAVLMTAKGSTQAAADRVNVGVLRAALKMCLLIGRVKPEQVVPFPIEKGKQECSVPIATIKTRKRRRSH